MGRKKKTVAQIKAAAKAAAKRMTLGKTNKMLGAAVGAIDAALISVQAGDYSSLPRRLVQNYSGVNINDGTVKLENAAKGLGAPIFNKLERAIFKGLNVPAPSLKRKGLSSKIGVGVYYGASIANAAGGSDNLDKFRRYVHSQYGVDLTQDGTAVLDYSKPIFEKVIPYIAVTKLMSWAMK